MSDICGRCAHHYEGREHSVKISGPQRMHDPLPSEIEDSAPVA